MGTRSKVNVTEYVKRLVEKYGYTYAHVEKFIAQKQMSLDMGGFADCLAWRPFTGEDLSRLPYLEGNGGVFSGVLAIQATMRSKLWVHVDKVVEGKTAEKLKAWLSCGGNRFEIWVYPDAQQRAKGARLQPRTLRMSLSRGELYYHNDSELELLGWQPADRVDLG